MAPKPPPPSDRRIPPPPHRNAAAGPAVTVPDRPGQTPSDRDEHPTDPLAPAAPPPSSRGVQRGGGGMAPAARDELPSVEIDDVLDGKYQLQEKLEEGGMGAVFVAHNIALDVPVAVKVIRSDLKGDAKRKLSDRLLQEARAAARLGHPAIVRAMDFGIAPTGDPYLVMELLDGEDLASALEQRGRVNPAKAVRILLPIAHALATAHDKGIVHRDLKPENIILAQTEAGQVQPKLIDFGIAKMHQRGGRRLTVLGDTLGTPEYMSPEQARGEDVNALADVWALCVMLYEMVTARLPFEADNYHALLRAIIEDEPQPITSLGVQNVELSAIIDRGLAKKKADRWPSMRQLGAALAAWLSKQGVTEDICGASLKATWLKTPSYESMDVLSSVPPPSTPRELPDVEIIGQAESPAPPSSTPSVELAEESAPDLLPPEPDAAASPEPAPVSDEAAAALPAAAVPAVLDEHSAELGLEAPAPVALPAPRRRSWLTYPLWLLAVTGLGWAVTGYLGIELPGLPARLPAPSFLADVLGLPEPPATAAAAAPEPAAVAEATTAASETTAEPEEDAETSSEPTDAPDAAAEETDAAATAEDAAAPRPPVRRTPPRLKRPTFD